jgi:hypothetical protein
MTVETFVMQKMLWCDSLYGQNISTLEIHRQLMLVFGDGVTTGIQQCVCMVGTKIHDGSSQTLMFGGGCSLQSFKGGANRSPESMVTL